MIKNLCRKKIPITFSQGCTLGSPCLPSAHFRNHVLSNTLLNLSLTVVRFARLSGSGIRHRLLLSRRGRHKTWWRHQMETFSVLLALWASNSPVTGEFPSHRPVTRSFDVVFDLLWTNCWANNRDAGDLRRCRARYDIIVMSSNGPCATWVASKWGRSGELKYAAPFISLRTTLTVRITAKWFID